MAKIKKRPLSICLDAGVYLLVRTIVSIIGIFPYESCRIIVNGLAVLFTDILPIRRKVLIQNLQNAFPESTAGWRHHLIRNLWQHLFLMGIEFFIGRRQIHFTNWKQYIRINKGSEYVQIFFPNRPLILVTGHFGNFEMGGHILGMLGYPTYSVARSLDNPFLNRYITQIRESAGQYLIEKNGGSDQIIDVIEHRGIVAFLADQSAGPKGCWVEFFGQSASAYKAMALLSLQYNAPIMVCHCTRIPQNSMQFDFVLDDLFDPLKAENKDLSVFDITQWFTAALEKAIRQHPEQYWWLHRRWKTFGTNIPVEKIRRKRQERNA